MNLDRVRELLEQVEAGQLSAGEALQALKWAPYEDLGYARLDTHRKLRTGYPEVVYCASKTVEQVVGIMQRLAEHQDFVLGTRASPEQATAVAAALPSAVYHQPARIIEVRTAPRPEPPPERGTVLVIAAGTADLPIAEEAA